MYRSARDGGRVVAMGSEEQPPHRYEESELAAKFASLSARVEALEHELAQIRPKTAEHPAPPPPRPEPPPRAGYAPHATPAASLEDRIASQLFSRIGIVTLLIAT